MCGECGITPDYINVTLMVDNWLPAFDMEEQVAAVLNDLKARKKMISPVTEGDRMKKTKERARLLKASCHILRVSCGALIP